MRLDLALIGFAGRLRDDQHSRLASPISTTKVETVHPHEFSHRCEASGITRCNHHYLVIAFSVKHLADICNHIQTESIPKQISYGRVGPGSGFGSGDSIRTAIVAVDDADITPNTDEATRNW